MVRIRLSVYLTAAAVVLASVLWATLVTAAPSSQPEDISSAPPLTVTKTVDTNDGVCNTDCSLREAIAAANSGDTIIIPAGIYTLTLGSQLTIDKSLTLSGAGSENTVIQAATSSADATSRVLMIAGDNPTVAISDVTIRHGNASGAHGGGILNTQGGKLRGILKKCVNGQAVYPLSEQHGIEAQERR